MFQNLRGIEAARSQPFQPLLLQRLLDLLLGSLLDALLEGLQLRVKCIFVVLTRNNIVNLQRWICDSCFIVGKQYIPGL